MLRIVPSQGRIEALSHLVLKWSDSHGNIFKAISLRNIRLEVEVVSVALNNPSSNACIFMFTQFDTFCSKLMIKCAFQMHIGLIQMRNGSASAAESLRFLGREMTLFQEIT